MIDIRRLRTELETVRAELARRGVDTADLDHAAALDVRQRELAGERDGVRARVKDLSKAVGAAKRSGDEAEAARLAAESRRLGDEEKRLDTEHDEVAERLREVLLGIPNTPAPDAPEGLSAASNVVARVVGADPASFADHQRVPHWEIGTALGILDLERGAKISGSMFPLYRGWGARLVRALVQYALDLNGDAFEEVRPPTLVLTETMTATGHLPKFADDAYHVERDDLWAVPTAEVPLTSMARGEILDEAALPLRLMAHTSCFRREAGSAGRDTRGLLRVHEFDKVELLAYTTPDQAAEAHELIVSRAEAALAGLGLTYRVVDLCAGDLSFSAARCFDLEAYAPGVDQWLEVSSVSWFGDFQARRAGVRYRPAAGGGAVAAHTLNGSGLAVPRVWAALVETHRRADGSIAVPEPLRRYLGDATAIPPEPEG